MSPRLAFRREQAALVAFPLLFVPLFFVGDAPARTVGYVLLAVTLWSAWDRAALARIVRTPPFLAAAAYLGFALVSTAWSDRGPWGVVEGAGKYVNTLAFIAAAALLAHRQPAALRLAERVFVVAGTIAALVAIGLFAVRFGRWQPDVRLEGLGASANSVVAAILYGAALLVAAVRLWPAAATRAGRVAVLAAGTVLLAAVLMTHSRGPLLALAMTLTLVLALQDRRAWRWLLAGAVVAAVALTVSGSWEVLLYRGLSYRPEIWALTLERVAQAPWLGLGSSSRLALTTADGFSAASAHNIILSALLTTGIVGTTLLMAMLGRLAVDAVRAVQACGDRLPAALLLFTIGYGLVDRQLDLRNLAPEYLTIWYAAGLLAAAGLRRPQPADGGSADGRPERLGAVAG